MPKDRRRRCTASLSSAPIQKGAALTTSHGKGRPGIADYVLWGVLDVYQGGPARRAAQAAHDWKRLPYRELEGSRWKWSWVSGAIGQGGGARAKAFGAHYHPASAAAAGPTPRPIGMVTPARFLDNVIADADVVALCAPATPETAHIANAGGFGRMKPGSVLVNVGRAGALVDERPRCWPRWPPARPPRGAGRVRGGAAAGRQPVLGSPAGHPDPARRPA